MLLFGLYEQGWQTLLAFAIVIIFAFAYHEYAHAIVADRLGDPTPRKNGRITLNPLPHLSIAGLIMLFMFGFGGAFTPINPSMLKGKRLQSEAAVAIAGPIANLIMAAIFAGLFRLFASFTEPMVSAELYNFLQILFFWGVRLNVFLAIFNLVPIPPLDGFTILMGMLPRKLANQIAPLRQYGMLILLGALFLLPRIGIDIFGGIISPAIDGIMRFLIG